MQKNKGFTLIELLVVIVLASVVLASLSSARQKGADAKIQAQLSNMRAQAELYYNSQTPASYGTANTTAGSCTEAGTIFTDANGLLNLLEGVANPTCNSIGTAWAVSAPLVSDATQFFCVDSIGTAETGTKVANATTGLCEVPTP
ncbi:MAG: hypothetical protein O210_OD1C00001G0463 [Parcubacteria bacterium RAAC4_OD1_1]|nr:MAG: hypothetical protein O210_OD1C00001G0463 [Parcubacteria bacterium RAAC4_OD1_1]